MSGLLATAALWVQIPTSLNNKMRQGVAKKIYKKISINQTYISAPISQHYKPLVDAKNQNEDTGTGYSFLDEITMTEGSIRKLNVYLYQ